MNITEMRKLATAVVGTQQTIEEKKSKVAVKLNEVAALRRSLGIDAEALENAEEDFGSIKPIDMLAMLDHLARLSDKARALATCVMSSPGRDDAELAEAVLDELIWETATKVAELDDLDTVIKTPTKKAPLTPPRKPHKPGPWLGWNGYTPGAREPVPDDTRLEVRNRKGDIWDCLSQMVDWRHRNAPNDIVAYRVLETHLGESP